MVETTAANPELLADQVARILVQPLEAASIVLASGVRIFDTAGVLRIPRLVSGSSVGWVGEGGQIPDDHDVEFDEIRLMPTERKSLKTILRFTRELSRQSVIGLDAVLRQRVVTDVANALDEALLTGAGDDDKITGLIRQPGIQTATWDASDADTLLDMVGQAFAAEVTPNRWFFSGADFIALRKVKVATDSNEYLLERDITSGPTYRLKGIPVTVSNRIPTGTAILADTSQIAVARDLAPSVTVLVEKYADTDEIGLKVVTRYDLGLLHPEAVIVGTTAAPPSGRSARKTTAAEA